MSQDPYAERRAALQNALLRRIERVTATNRPEIFLEPGAAEQMRELTALLTGEARDLSRFLLGWGHWYRHISLPEDPDQAELASALYVLSPWFQAGIEPQRFPGPARFMLAKLAVRRAEAMLRGLEQTEVLDMINETAGLWQRIVAATPDDEDRPSYLTNLANALMARSARTGDPDDLDEAIGHLRSALALAPAHDPGRKYMLTNLGGGLLRKFRRADEQADLDEAISHLRAALALTPPDDPVLNQRLSNLATALQDRFERRGELTDLDEAIGHLRVSAEITPPDSAERADVLGNLGTALRAHFDRTIAPADLDQAIENLSKALAIAGQDQPSRAHLLNNYGNALATRYSRSGALGDLDDAVTYLRQATAVMPPDHPDRKNTLSNAGNTLQQRFSRLGVQADLDEAISDLRAALDATPPGRPDRPGRLSDLAAALLVQFGRAEVRADLDEAIEVLRKAVDTTPLDHPELPGRWSNLGAALEIRFTYTGSAADLKAAVASLEQAVDGVPADDPRRAGYQGNLADALLDRFDGSRHRPDLDRAIAYLEDAVAMTPADAPAQARHLSRRGFARLRTGTQADAEQAADDLQRAADVSVAAPSLRIGSARMAAELIRESRPGRAAELLQHATLLLPEVAPRRQARTDQQYALGGFAGLAADAAALTLADPAKPAGERAELALRLLETGRGVLLSQGLQVRTALSDLAARHPELAARFSRLRERLDTPEATDRMRLAGDFDLTLAEIRAQGGFETFAQPPTVDELVVAARPGPIVVFNVSQYRSDALLLTADGVKPLPLPGLAYETVIDRVNAFHGALDLASSGRTAAIRIGAQASLREILGWLWDHGVGPVLDALGYRDTPAPGVSLPRVWWAPGGLLSLLPVHAAGQALDRVVSSYTFTVASLRHTRQHPSSPEPATALIVAMPTTPGIAGRLDHAEEEARRVAAHWPRSVTLIEAASGAALAADDKAPNSANVLRLLPSCGIAHFACHGTTDPADPGRSCLFLEDHLMVAALTTLNLTRARLAYLSACRTAITTDERLLDEAIHLASAFQLAGYPHVVGTLWTIRDERALDIADAFYTALDKVTPAEALHAAVRSQRGQFPLTPSLWAGYLHVGP